jgi:hypothetical protein
MAGTRRALVAIVFGVLGSPFLAPTGAQAADAKTAPAKSPVAKPAAAAAKAAPQLPNLTAEQIVEKHVAARGGARAWKSVETLQLSGKIDAGNPDSYERSMKMVRTDKRYKGKPSSTTTGNTADSAPGQDKQADKDVLLPFKLDVKRPHKSRLEIEFAGKTAVQVYDGEHGWKLRPFLNRNDVEPFTADEAKSSAAQDSLEGPLVDYAAKGTKISVESVEAIEGGSAYKLKLTMKDGSTKHVWIDGKTYLDVKVQGTSRRMDGRMHEVFVYQRDFRKVEGVMIPFVLETAVDGYPDKHRMVVEKATVNPQLDDALFTKPHA